MTIKFKEEICDISRRLYDKNFVAATDGNVSYRVSDKEIWITPTGVSKGFVKKEDLVCVDLDGNIVSAGFPSSELKMHLKVYSERKDIFAIVHAHPIYANISGIRNKEINMNYLAEGILNLGHIGISEYGTPSTSEVSDSILPFLKDKGLILRNHGALTWGKDLKEAYYRMETLEYMAKINFLLDLVGDGKEIEANKIKEILELKDR